MQTITSAVLWLTLAITSILWLSSYTHHSSIGMDHDEKQGERILHKFYRVNWTGHGSILIGYGSTWKDASQHPTLERFDPAHALLVPAKKVPDAKQFWNKVGFWYINSAHPRPTFWIGVPSWLPVILLLGVCLFRHKALSKPA